MLRHCFMPAAANSDEVTNRVLPLLVHRNESR